MKSMKKIIIVESKFGLFIGQKGFSLCPFTIKLNNPFRVNFGEENITFDDVSWNMVDKFNLKIRKSEILYNEDANTDFAKEYETALAKNED